MSGPRPLGALALLTLLLLGGRPAHAQLNCDVGIDFYPGGALRSCTLNGHHRLHTARGEPLTCASGHPALQYEDGRLRSCVLREAFTAGAVSCPAGHRVELTPDGDLAACRP